MDYRYLGDTGLEVSVLGFGASPLGDEFGAIRPVDGQRAVDCALDHGVTYFDVAPYYGRTLAEERLGAYLAGKRHRVVLATKAGRYDRDWPEGFDFSAARITASVEESLRRLRTDVIDVYQLHDVEFGDRQVLVNEALPALQRLKEQGKVRAIGITGYPLACLRDLAAAADVDVILSYAHYNLMNTRLDRELAPFARARGIGLINASPLHMGMLTEAGPPDWHPAPDDVREVARRVADWCREQGVDLAALALQFALDYDAVATTLVGMSTEAQVTQNVRAVSVQPDPDVLRAVRQMIAPVADRTWPSGRPENHTQQRSGPDP